MSGLVGFQYVVLRCVPRVEREEFVNVGVVVYAQMADFLRAACHVDEDRLRALAPDVDLDALASALDAVESVCRGDDGAGRAGRVALGARFGFLAAPRSTVVQPSPIHGGVTTDPAAELQRLVSALVG